VEGDEETHLAQEDLFQDGDQRNYERREVSERLERAPKESSLDEVVRSRQDRDVALFVDDTSISSIEEIAFATEPVKVGPASTKLQPQVPSRR
jgi:hypothetical protein